MSKTLAPEQVLRAAVATLLDGVDQHVIASIMGVNQGRINEAAKAVEWAIHNVSEAYKLSRNP